MNDDLKKEIRKAALQNAVEHDGKTKDKIILSKVLGTAPEFKSRVKEIIPEITLIVSEINSMSLEQQRTEIQNDFPEIFSVEEKIKEDRVGFPPLEDAAHGCYHGILVARPPSRHEYPHCSHGTNSEHV